MAAPTYIVLTREPGEKFKVVAMGKGRKSYYFGKYQECLKAGMIARFETLGVHKQRIFQEHGKATWETTER